MLRYFYILDDVTPIPHHVHTPRRHSDHTYHHYHDNSFPAAQPARESPIPHAHERVPAVSGVNEVHHHHYGNNVPIANQAPAPTDVVRHHHYNNAVPQTPVDGSAVTTINQVHRHHHYGNGDFTMELKKKRARKKDYCNISEHEDLVRYFV